MAELIWTEVPHGHWSLGRAPHQFPGSMSLSSGACEASEWPEVRGWAPFWTSGHFSKDRVDPCPLRNPQPLQLLLTKSQLSCDASH